MKEALNECLSHEEMVQAIKQLDLSELCVSDYHFISKKLKQTEPMRPFRVAYLGNFTIAPLNDYVEVYAANNGLSVSSHLGEYDQYHQEILDDSGDVKNFDPHMVMLALSLRKLTPEVVCDFSLLSTTDKKRKIDEILTVVEVWAAHAIKKTNANVLICNFPKPDYLQFGIADLKSEFGETEFYLTLNLKLIDRFKNSSRIQIIDLEKLATRYGKHNIFNPKLYYLAKMEWPELFMPCIAEEIIRYVKANQNLTKKCLVLDLDDTLWGGVVGEEGPLGIKVGRNYDPVSEAYYYFQKTIIGIKNRGIILAICSKNNVEDAMEAFDTREDMPLKKEDFSTIQINWNNKHENLVRIAQTLNIGIDSIVFVDDNPAECSLVQQMLPEVTTVCLPKDPSRFVNILERLDVFEKIAITKEDSEKSGQYQQNMQRQDFKAKFSDLSSFLESLKTTITVRQAQAEDLNRVHQLFTKTNQFNVTTIRYNLADIENFCENERFDFSIVEAKDRFGVLGTIGVYLLEQESSTKYRVDSFILSCRAMGRGIESAIMNHVKKKYILENTNQNTVITAHFIPTPKNKPVAQFFENQGFEITEKLESGEKKYLLQEPKAQTADCGWINVLEKEEYHAR